MAFELAPLPYELAALEPHISKETLEYHYGKHHRSYVEKLNGMVAGTDLEKGSLEAVIRASDGGLYNNAAQVWNHSFYWNCLSPSGGGEPQGALAQSINATFGSFDAFKQQFTEHAGGNFGSGWTWLVQRGDGSIGIHDTGNAGCPITDDLKPLLTVDVWEHAYYIDYRNARPDYLEAFWKLVNWEFVASNME